MRGGLKWVLLIVLLASLWLFYNALPRSGNANFHNQTVMPIELYLNVDEKALQELEDALPQPPIINMLPEERKWVKAKLKMNEDVFDVKFRYRGDLDRHWRYDKRSITIKFLDESPFEFDKFSLIIPEDRNYHLERFSMYLANKLGVPVPWNALVKLSINDSQKLMYYMFEPFGETFLIRNGLLDEGVILNGDVHLFYRAEEYNGESIDLYDLFADLLVSPAYFDEHFRNIKKEKFDDYSMIYDFLLELNQPVPDVQKLISMFDKENLFAMNVLLKIHFSTHVDNWHNWKLFYSVETDKFSFLPWDISGNIIEDVVVYKDVNYDYHFLNYFFYLLNQNDEYNAELSKRVKKYVAKNEKKDLRFLDKLHGDFLSSYMKEVQRKEVLVTEMHVEKMTQVMKETYIMNRNYDVQDEYVFDDSLFTKISDTEYEISSDVLFEEDIIIPADVHVVVRPGVTLNMGEDVSIISYGRLDFLGTEKELINVKAANPSNPWGLIYFIDKGSTGSKVEYVNFISGGDDVLSNFGNQIGPLRYFNTLVDVSNLDFVDTVYNDEFLELRSYVSVIYLRDKKGDLIGFDIISDTYDPVYIQSVEFYEKDKEKNVILMDIEGANILNISDKSFLSRNIYQFSLVDDWSDGIEVPSMYRFYLDEKVDSMKIEFANENLTVKEVDVFHAK